LLIIGGLSLNKTTFSIAYESQIMK